MISIKFGENVKDEIDLQNLITHELLTIRDEKGFFSKNDIKEALQKDLAGSFFIENGKLKISVIEKLEETIKVLLLSDYLKYDRKQKKFKFIIYFPSL